MSLLLPDNVFLLWTDRQAGREREGGETLALHAEEHVQRTLGMFRYLLKQLCMGKKRKSHPLCFDCWSKGAGPI